MTKASKTTHHTGVLVSAIEEVPRISDQERAALRESLGRAKADKAAGHFDEFTSASLRAEFKAIYNQGKTNEDIDADLARAADTKS